MKQQLLSNDGVLLMPAMPDIAPLLTAEESELHATATPPFKCSASQA